MTHRLTAKYFQSQSLSDSHRLTAIDPLEAHLKSFLLHCRVKRLSKSSISNYAYQNDVFIQFCQKNGITRLDQVNKMTFELFFLELEQTNCGTSCKDYYKSIKRFFRWLVWEDALEHNPMEKVEPPKEDTNIIQPFATDQINALLRACNPKYLLGLRNRAIIKVLYESGCRLREMSEMKVSDVSIDNEAILVMGKGNRQRWVTVYAETIELIYKYLKTRKVESDYLWLSATGTPLTRDGIYQVIAGLAKKCSIKGVRCSPHTFRHTRATDLLRDGVEGKYIQTLLGHKDPRMVQRYQATINSQDALNAIRSKGNKRRLI